MRLTGLYPDCRNNYVDIVSDSGLLRVSAVTDVCVRCVYTKKYSVEEDSPIGIAASVREEAVPLGVSEYNDRIELYTDSLTISVNKDDGIFTWIRRSDGKLLLEEGGKELTETVVMKYTTGGEEPIVRRIKTVDGERNFIDNLREEPDRTAYRAKLFFRFQDGERIHGLGQGEEGIYDYRGHVQYLYQHNMRIPMPFLLSSLGYGVLVDCGSLMTFNDDERGSYLFCDTVEQLDYYFIYGNNTDEIIAGYRELTGRAAMLPKWAFGYVQSREKYNTQDELVEVGKRYRGLGVGLDCIVQDWKTWPDDDWGSKVFDRGRYPDVKAVTDELHSMNIHTMISVWPNMTYGTTDYTEIFDAGYMLHDLATYDAFAEGGRALYWKQCSRELFAGGFDSWWCDSTEPFSGPDWGGEGMREPWERYMLVGGEHKKFLGAERANLYALAHAQGIFENQRKEAPGKRVLNLTRSGYAGSQKYGTVLWSGDISARWDVLRSQITEGLNMAMSGIPYWTLDAGAFFTVYKNWRHRGCECDNDPSMKWFWHGDYEEGVDDLGYRELYVRWLQFAAFLPMFRSHGTDTPREIWQFGTPGQPDEIFYNAIAKTILDRYRLMPYIYSLAGAVVQDHATMVRSLLFDFADDEMAAGRSDEFMFGQTLLVCPVTEPMYYGAESTPLDVPKVRRVYLPAGTGWYDFHTGDYYAGGQELDMAVTLDHIPVFVREGSILPMEAGLTYADERPDTPFEIYIYPGADGHVRPFAYYEDAGDDYGYERSVFNRILFCWNGCRDEFSIGGAAYEFENGLKGRECRITVVGTPKEASFVYEGEPKTVRL